MEACGKARKLTVVTGREYRIDSVDSLEILTAVENGVLKLTVSSNASYDRRVSVMASGVKGLAKEAVIPANGSVTLEADITDPAVPYVGLIIPADSGERYEFADARL